MYINNLVLIFRQARDALQSRWGEASIEDGVAHNPTNIDMQIRQLMDLGFANEDCQRDELTLRLET